MTRHALPLMLGLGLVSGALGGMMGVGGGILLVPLLTHLLGEPQHDAQATSLAFIIVAALIGVVPYFAHGRLDLGLAAVLAAGAVVGVVAGARVAHGTPAAWLRRAFGVAIVATAVRLLAAPPAHAAEAALWPWFVNVGVGLGVGFLAGLLGIGGGTILVPLLVLAQGVPQHVAQGVALLMIVPVGLVGALTYARSGHVAGRDLPGLLVGGAAGAFFGAQLAQSLRGPTLSRLFAVFLIAVAARMIFGKPRARTAPAES
ncbi:MAG: TSUP family transporter [Hyphomicrobiales bacterium]